MLLRITVGYPSDSCVSCLDRGKGKGPVLATAWGRLVTKSALQLRKWQLIGVG